MTVLLACMMALGVSILIALIRVILGPTAFDRVLAVNSIGTIVIIGVVVHGLSWDALSLLILLFYIPSLISLAPLPF